MKTNTIINKTNKKQNKNTMKTMKDYLKTAIIAIVVMATTMPNTLLAQRIPGWLSAGWYEKEAKFFDEFVFKLESNGTLQYKVGDEVKSVQATVNMISNTVLFGKKEGTITYTLNGKEFTVKFFDEAPAPGVTISQPTGNTTTVHVPRSGYSYGPMGVLVEHLTFSDASSDDPIFGKLNGKTLFRNDGNKGAIGVRLGERPPRRIAVVVGPGKFDKAWVGKWYSQQTSATCKVEGDLMFEITADQKIKVHRGTRVEESTLSFVNMTHFTEAQVAAGQTKGKGVLPFTAIVFTFDGKSDTMGLFKPANVQGNSNLSGMRTGNRRNNLGNVQESDVFTWNSAGTVFRAKKQYDLDANFDQNLVGMWYLEAPKAAQFFQGKLSATNGSWSFLIFEHNCKFLHGTPSMGNPTQHSRNSMTTENGEMVIGRNRIAYKVEGNKLTITGGISGSGGGMGVNIRNGVYYRYDPSLPKVTENEVAAEAAQGAAGLFRR